MKSGILHSIKNIACLITGLVCLSYSYPVVANDGAHFLASRSLVLDIGYTPGSDMNQNLVPNIKDDLVRVVSVPKDAAAIAKTVEEADIDTSALYYYAKEGQHERVDAEIVRLATLHPGFTAPNDLYERASKVTPNEAHLWEMFARDDFAAIDAEFSKKLLSDPNWQPSEDFSTKLARKRLRLQMTELARLKDWIGVLNAGQMIDPETEANIDLVWLMIDAYAHSNSDSNLGSNSHSGKQNKLLAAYQGLLSRDAASRLSDQELVATLQRATRDFPAIDVQRAMMNLWPNAHQMPQLEPLRLSIARRAVSDFNQDDDILVPPPGLDIKRLKYSAEQSQNISDLSLLGWYYQKLKDYDQALVIFERLFEIEPKADPAKGYYLALARSGQHQKAYQFAKQNLAYLADDPTFLMNVLSTKLTKSSKAEITDEMLKAYSRAILDMSDADHSEILAWYAYNARQFEAAKAWFEKSVFWNVSADNLKGLALSYRKLGEKELYRALKDDYQDSHRDIWENIEKVSYGKRQAEKAISKLAPTSAVARVTSTRAAATGASATNLSAQKTPSKAKNTSTISYIQAYERKDYRACLAQLDKLAQNGLSPQASLIKGWCYLAMARVSDAQKAFQRAMDGGGGLSGADRQSVRNDAIYGKALSLLRVRQTDDAEALIRTYPLAQKRQDELLSEIYFQRARAAFDRKDFDMTLRALNARALIGPEPRDLTLMRAWSLHNLGERRAANLLFKRLNAHMRDDNASYGAFITKG